MIQLKILVKLINFCNIFYNNHSGKFRNKYVEVQNVKIEMNVPTLRAVKKM